MRDYYIYVAIKTLFKTYVYFKPLSVIFFGLLLSNTYIFANGYI